MLSRCFHFGVFEIFVSSLFLLVLFAFWECWYSALYNSEADSQKKYHAGFPTNEYGGTDRREEDAALAFFFRQRIRELIQTRTKAAFRQNTLFPINQT